MIDSEPLVNMVCFQVQFFWYVGRFLMARLIKDTCVSCCPHFLFLVTTTNRELYEGYEARMQRSHRTFGSGSRSHEHIKRSWWFSFVSMELLLIEVPIWQRVIKIYQHHSASASRNLRQSTGQVWWSQHSRGIPEDTVTSSQFVSDTYAHYKHDFRTSGCRHSKTVASFGPDPSLVDHHHGPYAWGRAHSLTLWVYPLIL